MKHIKEIARKKNQNQINVKTENKKTSPLRDKKKQTTTKHSGCLWLMRGKENKTKEKQRENKYM